MIISSIVQLLRKYLRTMLICFVILNPFLINIHTVLASNKAVTPEELAANILEGLSPEERVGQLFLVTFQGTEVGQESSIYNLITYHHVGGIVIRASNDNIIDTGEKAEDTVIQVYNLNHQLQQNVWNFSRQNQVNPINGENYIPAYIPLLMGVSQEGDGYPYDQILHGLTPIPNPLAIGATWTPERASQVGNILGKELSLLGFNLLLGPSLDILDAPQLEVTDNLGTRTFGGDPYWVGKIGTAYIKGVHQGSEGRVAIVAKHFPGHGSSDRVPEEEVATVRKSLEELKNFDLAPFVSVTGNSKTLEETVDALLVSHIRYQGLQGNIRATTRPVSLDPQALGLLLGLPELSNWRQSGGLMISDDLGSLAVRRFYELTSQTFDSRRVALNAFLAGNDLLYIADFTSDDELDPYNSTVRTLEFFSQKYRDDAAFAQRVDESVLRILTLKYRIYENFTLGDILNTQGSLSNLGQSHQVSFDVARQAATLISPSLEELDETIPEPPNRDEFIVVISDVRHAQQCSECPPYALLNMDDLKNAIIRLYGPQAGGQVTGNNLSSYSLADLQEMLDTDPITSQLERDLRRARWVVFMMLSNNDELPSFNTLRQFLTERPNLFQQKRLIVFSLCAPYYLDATNISKLTAYYGLYSKLPQFVDVAAYLLFGELRPNESPPVSVSGISYNLNAALFPNSEQTIPLELDYPEVDGENQTDITPEPTSSPELRLGDVLPLRTGVILDFNNNPVPDGTLVNFVFTTGGDSNPIRQVETTENGVSRTTFAISNPGTLEIQAESETARSNVIKFDIPAPNGETPTVSPTDTVAPIPSATATEIVILPTETTLPPASTANPDIADWLIAVLISAAVAFSFYLLAAYSGQVRWGVRGGFLALIGGLLGYSYLALQLPGTKDILQNSVTRNVFLVTLSSAVLGLLIAITWRSISTFERSRSED